MASMRAPWQAGVASSPLISLQSFSPAVPPLVHHSCCCYAPRLCYDGQLSISFIPSSGVPTSTADVGGRIVQSHPIGAICLSKPALRLSHVHVLFP